MFLPPVARPAAYAFAKLYECGVRGRLLLYESGWLKTYKLPAPVISVGNLTVGGTGKTPCTAYLANLLTAAGYRVAILSRGYQRISHGIVEVSDGEHILCSSAEAGDEPYLLAEQCPGARVIVGADRYAAGMWLWQRARADVFLLDDGYQHIRLQRDLNLALMDAREDLEQARLLPLGDWREPITGLLRVDAVIVTHAHEAAEVERLRQQLRNVLRLDVPIFAATHELTGLRRLPSDELSPLAEVANQPIAVLTAIAQPERFTADLRRHGLSIVVQQTFSDHHRYSLPEIYEALAIARKAGAATILTTEKDAANLPAELWREPLPLPIYAVQLRFQIAQADDLREFVVAALRHCSAEPELG